MRLRDVLALLALVFAFPAEAQERESVPRQLGDDLFFSGNEVHFNRDVPGNALLAGRHVSLNSRVNGDVVAAGGNVTIRGTVAEDLYAAGGDVHIEAQINGSARVAGGQVEIADQVRIGEGLSIAGGEVELNGHVGRYVQIAGGEVRINGRVDGDVMVSGGELRVGPAAVIQGELVFRGRERASVSESAQIQGGIRNITGKDVTGDADALISTTAIVWAVGWLIAGIVLIALLPGSTLRLTESVRTAPGRALLMGLALVLLIPIAIVVLTITLVGIPLALLLLLLYLVLLPLGYLGSVVTIGDAALNRFRGSKPLTRGARILAFVLVLVLVALLTAIPGVGSVLSVLLVLFGAGGIILAFMRRGGGAPLAQRA